MTRLDIRFNVTIPVAPPEAMAVCTTWINKYGKQKSAKVADGKHVIDIETSKFTYQNNLQRSLRNKLTQKGLGAICTHVSVFSNIVPGPTRKQLVARIAQLEGKAVAEQVAEVKAEETDNVVVVEGGQVASLLPPTGNNLVDSLTAEHGGQIIAEMRTSDGFTNATKMLRRVARPGQTTSKTRRLKSSSLRFSSF